MLVFESLDNLHTIVGGPSADVHAGGSRRGGSEGDGRVASGRVTTFEQLRVEQNSAWATQSVAKGVVHARAGRSSEAIGAYKYAIDLDDGRLQIADFGQARLLPDDGGSLSPAVATRWYRAPELLLGSRRYGAAVNYQVHPAP